LADHLKDHPEDLDGWLMLARSYAVLGRYADADAAYQHAQSKVMQDSAQLVTWIEMRLRLNGMKFDARSNELLDRAATLTPDDPDVLLLRALAAFGRGDQAGGDALVGKLHARFPPGTPEGQNLDAALQQMMPPAGLNKQ
jgi:cytochrome c-type biogenesis protein CcmH